ncbi:MAG TPA: hypothetical protein VEW03_11865 [Longimicrobiaceae bacterium]|nr:hypothetical protein [Longimicrobiaceae bacterium]
MRVITILAMVAVGVVLALDLAYLARGSLELYPTEEDQEKVRLVTGVLAVLLIGVEVALVALYRRLRRATRRTLR